MLKKLIVIEALKTRWNGNRDADLYYFRDQSGFEIDLILSLQRRLFPFEIKAARSYHPNFFRNLDKFASWSDKIEQGTVIYAGDQSQNLQAHSLLPFYKTASRFNEA